MQKLSLNPTYAKELGAQGYVQAKSKSIPDIKQHIKDIEQIYVNLISNKGTKAHAKTRTMANHI